MVASDFSDKDIALALGISSRTVRGTNIVIPKGVVVQKMFLQKYITIKTEFLN